MAIELRHKLDILVVIIAIILIILSLRGCIDTGKAPEKIFVEVPITVPPHKEIIHDTVIKKRTIIDVLPFDLTDTVKIKQLLFSLDSLQNILVAKNVDRIEKFDTCFSAYGDSICDSLHLKYWLLTSRKTIELDIKQREFKRIFEQVPIPIKKSNWFEQLISDYPLAAVGIAVCGGFYLGSQ